MKLRLFSFVVGVTTGVLSMPIVAVAQQSADASRNMNLSKAKRIIRQQMEYSKEEVIEISPDRIVYKIYSRDKSNSDTCQYVIEDKKIELVRSGFASNPNVRSGAADCARHGKVSFQKYCSSDSACERFYFALLVLQDRAKRASSMAGGADDSNFAQVAEEYKLAVPKPEFPERARRFRIQAEAAVRDKQLDDAADLYEEALKIAPWWPEGRFNRALILGELLEFREAMLEMKRYLQLVPDAPNARAAQDKIYEWEALGRGR